MLNKILYFLIILNIVALFFQGFVVPISGTFLYVYTFFIVVIFAFYAILNPSTLILKIKQLYNQTPFKFYTLFIIWLYVDALILIIMHKAKFLIFYYITVKLLPAFLLIYLLSAVFIPKYLSLKKTIKIFVGILFFIYTLGIIGFIGDLYNINIMKNIVNFFSNAKFLMQNVEVMLDYISGKPRLRSLFHEPGALANFIFLILPIVYNISLSRYRIFKNKVINFFAKTGLIPLSWLCLILTMSPIYVVFSGILTLLYFYKNIMIYSKKYCKEFLIIFFITIVLFYIIVNNNIDILQKSFIARIFNVLSSRDMYDLIANEGSLASRIINFVNSYILFIKNPILGYGYDNARFFMYDQFMNSPLPLNKEIINNLQYAVETGAGCPFSKSLLSGILVETGVIGAFLYFKFLFHNLKTIKHINTSFYGVERSFLNGIKFAIIALIATSYYTPTLWSPFMCFLYGLICSYKTQYIISKRKIFNESTKNINNNSKL